VPLTFFRDQAFEARWAAWIARGAAFDGAVRSRVRLAAPIAAIAGDPCVSLFVY
jgi:hypothetical protein